MKKSYDSNNPTIKMLTDHMLNNLNDLAMLVTVADKKGFSAAARVQNISPATVSKQISRIEKQMGVRLFNRNTRHLEITAEGQEIVKRVRMALALLDEAQSITTNTEGLQGKISITAPLSFGSRYIAPAVAEFCTLHPKLNIDLQLTNHIIDLYTQGLDIAIRFGHLPDSNLIAKHLATNKRILVASPNYLEKNGLPLQPKDLTNHHCLLFSYPGFQQKQWSLTNQHKPQTKTIINVTGELSSDNGDILTLWSTLGKGIALRETWDVTDKILSGKLIHILPDWEEPAIAINAIYLQRDHTPKRVSEFIKFIAQTWQDTPW